MSRAAIEAPAEAPKADNVWRPKWIGESGGWICERQRDNAEGKREIEHWGARMRTPEGVRFSAAHFPQEAVAQGFCDTLNVYSKMQSDAPRNDG